MTDDKREWARPVEEVAQTLGQHFYRELSSPPSWASCLEAARAAIATLRRLGMIHEDGLKAIREEERK